MNPLLKSTIFTLLFAPVLLLAEEEQVDHCHTPSPYLQDSQKEEFHILPAVEEEEGACGFIFDKYPPIYYSSSHHWLAAVCEDGSSLELGDGSLWKVSPYDAYKVIHWCKDDHLMITQNTSWFSRYNYRIINRHTRSSIEVNFDDGPLIDSPQFRYVVSIDPLNGTIALNDNTYWEICPADWNLFKHWKSDHAVIVGFNSGWYSSYEGLLINVNHDHFIRAKQY